MVVDLGLRARSDARLPDELLPPVAEHDLAVSLLAVQLAFLRERVLDLEQIGEVSVRLDPQLELDGLGAVVEDGDVLVDALSDEAPADHRERGAPVDRRRRRNKEELGDEIVPVVDGEALERPTVDRQPPAGEVARVAVEETVRLISSRGHVSAPVADEERRAVEDVDRLGHPAAPYSVSACRALG